MVRYMKIGLDFDRVLFNTDRFKKYLFKEIEGFDETYPQACKKVYRPEKHAEILGIEPGKIREVLDEAERFVYPDIEQLEKFPEDIQTIIVSRGDKKFQNIKIEKSGALEYVDGVFILHDKPKDFVDIDCLVDDRKEELENIEVPGFHFDRERHGLDDIRSWVDSLNG